jgi:hypothetical protein
VQVLDSIEDLLDQVKQFQPADLLLPEKVDESFSLDVLHGVVRDLVLTGLGRTASEDLGNACVRDLGEDRDLALEGPPERLRVDRLHGTLAR